MKGGRGGRGPLLCCKAKKEIPWDAQSQEVELNETYVTIIAQFDLSPACPFPWLQDFYSVNACLSQTFLLVASSSDLSKKMHTISQSCSCIILSAANNCKLSARSTFSCRNSMHLSVVQSISLPRACSISKLLGVQRLVPLLVIKYCNCKLATRYKRKFCQATPFLRTLAWKASLLIPLSAPSSALICLKLNLPLQRAKAFSASSSVSAVWTSRNCSTWNREQS